MSSTGSAAHMTVVPTFQPLLNRFCCFCGRCFKLLSRLFSILLLLIIIILVCHAAALLCIPTI
jgi:uncharacterized membrane protein